MNLITIWHNPKCSKSKEALRIIEESGLDKKIVDYLQDTPSREDLKKALVLLAKSARELMRTKEDIYVELNLKDELEEDSLIDSMLKNPILIERPVIFKNSKAIIGRPTSIVNEFILS